jgi:phosphatidate cytidylyltransferase
MSAQLPKRIAVAVVGIPAAFAVVYVGGWLLAALIAILGAVGTIEMLNMSEAASARPNRWLAVVGSILAPFAVLGLMLGWLEPRWAISVAAIWIFLTLAEAVFTYREGDPAITSVATGIFSPVYASLMPSALLWLRHGVEGAEAAAATSLVFFPLVMTWVCDSFAMGGGALMGGPKFAPKVSPNKTWSGTLTGLFGALLIAFIFSRAVFGKFGLDVPVIAALMGGVVVGVLGQLGDLTESVFKRSVGVKDSGTFFPGHGGVLDRLDSLYWSLPLVAFVLSAFGVL